MKATPERCTICVYKGHTYHYYWDGSQEPGWWLASDNLDWILGDEYIEYPSPDVDPIRVSAGYCMALQGL